MDLIVLRSVPRPNTVTELRPSIRGQQSSENPRLMSMEEVRRKWVQKQEARRAMLTYTPQPA